MKSVRQKGQFLHLKRKLSELWKEATDFALTVPCYYH